MDERRTIAGLLGIGTYTAPEASRLTGIPRQRIARWLGGRWRRYGPDRIFDDPLWVPELPDFGDELHLGFRDLVELRMVDAFRRQGLSLPYVRKVVRAAQDMLNDTHPFTSKRFKTDGRRLYLEIVSETKEPRLIEVLKGQYAFHSIVSHGLRDLEFDDGKVARWVPRSGRGDVVVDPGRSFGQPVLAHSGVPTAIILLQANSGQSPRQLAVQFEIEERAVRSALGFEEQLAA